jgi:hypothetical protein
MRLSQHILIAGAATIAMVVFSPGPAMARGYSGSWPVTVTKSQHSNGTYCLTLGENGTASVLIGSKRYNGSFLVINRKLVATITVQAYSQNAGLVFIGSASHGSIGPGVFEDVYGGSDFDSGALAFGMNGDC